MTAQVGGASFFDIDRFDFDNERGVASLKRTDIRRRLLVTRRAVTAADQKVAARCVAHRLSQAMVLRPGRRIGIYLSMPGELNLTPTIELAQSRACQLFVPHVISTTRNEMQFYPYRCGARLRLHRWGMPQLSFIDAVSAVSPITLDAILVPTVAFDADGHRLGMGGGFYDRHFAHLRSDRRWHRPQLIGVAYSFQEVPTIAAQPHDVHLDAVVTERAFMRFKRVA